MEVTKKLLVGIMTGAALVLIIIVAVVATVYATRGPPPPKTWINGDYKVGGINEAIVHVDDEGETYRQLKFLDSEDTAYQPMSWVGGEDNDTVVITLNGNTKTARISKDKKTISGGPGTLQWSNLTWITPEEAEIINNREKEPVSAPKLPYPLRPGVKGKLAWVSGPPGSGKSTIAGIIAKDEGWIFYEGDGFFLGFNPYVFPNESQVDARSEKPALIGPGMGWRGLTVLGWLINQDQLGKNQTKDTAPTDRFYQLMAEDILKERNRVGGDWIVAFALGKRREREVVRKVLGEDLLFVVLDISLDLVKKRLAGRGKGEEELAKEHWKYEPAGENEHNTVGFKIVEKASKQENANAVLDLINKNSNK